MSAQPQPAYYTPEQYLALEREAEFKSQYLYGGIWTMAGSSIPHNRISANVAREIGNRPKGSPCEAFFNDLRVTVLETGLRTYPDVIVVCGETQAPPQDKDSIINPTVLVEVLSPSTETFDRGEKFAHYRRIETLAEYVLISQDKIRLEYYVRGEDDHWDFREISDQEKSLTLPSLGCDLPLSGIYARVRFAPPTSEEDSPHSL